MNVVERLVAGVIVCASGAAMLYVSIMVIKNGYLYFEEPRLPVLYGDIGFALGLIGYGIYFAFRRAK